MTPNASLAALLAHPTAYLAGARARVAYLAARRLRGCPPGRASITWLRAAHPAGWQGVAYSEVTLFSV